MLDRDHDVDAGSTGALLLSLLVDGPASRAELARRLGLSAPSVTRLTAPLLASGRLVEGEPVAGPGLGRPSRPLDLVADAESFAGVKLTGDAVHVAVTDLRGAVLARGERPHCDPSPGAVLDAVAALVVEVAAGRDLTGIGVTLGGRSVDGRTAHDPLFLGWHHVPVADLLERRTGLPVTVANDVDGLTRAQHWFGAGRGHDDLALVTVGAGVGLGSVVAGRLVAGAAGAAGDVGHVLVESGPEARTCPAGHHGCASSLLTTRALVDAAGLDGAGAGDAVPGGEAWTRVLAAAATGDRRAATAVRRAGRGLGRLVGTVVAVHDPEVVLVAGEGAPLAAAAADDLREGLVATAPWAHDLPVLVQPPDFDEWARGAAVVAVHARTTRTA